MKKIKPEINVFNRQRTLSVETRPLKEFLHELSGELALQVAFSVVLLSDASMSTYNQEFRGQHGSTDVLSFPNEKDYREEEAYLGDILISVETAYRQCEGALSEELKVLCLHGLLHLIGYDHETDQGEMEEVEKRLKRDFKLH